MTYDNSYQMKSYYVEHDDFFRYIKEYAKQSSYQHNGYYYDESDSESTFSDDCYSESDCEYY